MMDELLTVKEVSQILKTNVDYVHSLRKSGLLPFIKIGCYKCRKETLMDFLKDMEGMDISDPYHVKELNGYEAKFI
jgi:hypothetical protein